MGQAIGDVLPFAIGVAISPIPIIAIILMLLSSRAGANSAAFLGGWFAGVTGAAVVLLFVVSEADGSSDGPSTTSGIIKLVLGALCLVLAFKNLRDRPSDDAEPELPSWLSSIESITPGKSLGLGVLLSALNPKNLLMIGGGMAVIAPLGLSGGDAAIVVAVFVVIAISTVLAPVVVYRMAGEGAQRILDGLRDWLEKENAVVMGVLMLVIGVVLVGKGIAVLA